MGKYTPGPWAVDVKQRRSAYAVTAEDQLANNPLQLALVNGGAGGDEAAANALLIASAPDLLEACQIAFANLKPKYPSCHLVMQKLTEAISKATGDTP